MSSRIEDYALIGDCRSAAMVARDGSIDWFCAPRFDSGACFAALLGSPEHGRWQIAPSGGATATRRRYRDGTLVLETEYETDAGVVALVDCMPVDGASPTVVRLVEGRRGRVAMRLDLTIRFDYGSIIPTVQIDEDGLRAIAGPDSLHLDSRVPLRHEGSAVVAEFAVEPGQSFAFALSWHPSHEPPPPPVDAGRSVRATEGWWRDWSGRCEYAGPHREAVLRSLIVLKAMTYGPTGGIVAAPTTSLPERLGGSRNWDYRYCWLRDASFTLFSLVNAGYLDEAQAWRDWLLRAVAGTPAQIMYGISGEHRLTEQELPWLPGYEGSTPVRVGNSASKQFQLDVYGEVLDAMYRGRKAGLRMADEGWDLERSLLESLESDWMKPDDGIWEIRGPRRHFVHSKVMAWAAFDRAVKTVEQFGLHGPAGRWRLLRDKIHEEACREGFDVGIGAFVQSYGSKQLDASVLLMPLVGFLPASDPRMQRTVRAIEGGLMDGGFVARYSADPDIDGLPPGEGAFLACSFWMADNLVLMGRREEAECLFGRLLAIRNDVGLLSEEYDVATGRLVGNFPQAFSHIGLINTAFLLARDDD